MKKFLIILGLLLNISSALWASCIDDLRVVFKYSPDRLDREVVVSEDQKISVQLTTSSESEQVVLSFYMAQAPIAEKIKESLRQKRPEVRFEFFWNPKSKIGIVAGTYDKKSGVEFFHAHVLNLLEKIGVPEWAANAEVALVGGLRFSKEFDSLPPVSTTSTSYPKEVSVFCGKFFVFDLNGEIVETDNSF
ncbi:MAG: hypothetical protein AB7F43_12185 [Bacteriovoracia bacterium]